MTVPSMRRTVRSESREAVCRSSSGRYGLLNTRPLTHASKLDSAYSNTPKDYKKLTELLTRARLAGHIPFKAISDDTRPVVTWDVHTSTQTFIREHLDGLLKGFYRDLQRSQPSHCELLVEKNTLVTILRPVAMEFCLPLTSMRGYCSLQPRHAIAQRFRRSGKQRLVLVVVSDFDADGEEILMSLARSMRDDFDIANIHVVKAGLTREQTHELDPPPALKAKNKSKNYQKFVEASGSDDCWEVEAVKPEQLQELVRDAIRGVMDIDLLNAEAAQERVDSLHLAAARSRNRSAA